MSCVLNNIYCEFYATISYRKATLSVTQVTQINVLCMHAPMTHLQAEGQWTKWMGIAHGMVGAWVQRMANQSTWIPTFITFTKCTSLPMSSPDSAAARGETLLICRVSVLVLVSAFGRTQSYWVLGIGWLFWYRSNPNFKGSRHSWFYPIPLELIPNPTA